jgi:hypothetical protein
VLCTILVWGMDAFEVEGAGRGVDGAAADEVRGSSKWLLNEDSVRGGRDILLAPDKIGVSNLPIEAMPSGKEEGANGGAGAGGG